MIDYKWYEKNYTPWIDNLNSTKEVMAFQDTLNPKYKQRFDYWFSFLELEGHTLELGFNSGKTLRWLSEKYDNIEITGIDFNPRLMKIIPHLMDISPKIKTLFIADINRMPINVYGFDHITCLDFVEHLYFVDYLEAIKNIRMLLQNGGRCYVFAGHGKLPEHVNILSVEEIRKDFMYVGLKFVQRINHPGTNDSLQIFEK